VTDGRRAGVLGSPIAHSLSPALHLAAYRSLGLDWTYAAYEVDEDSLPGFIAALDSSWVGLSLTMPLKEAVIALLDDVDPVARAVRAVNTVVPFGSGWRGVNTDIFGIIQSLREAGTADVIESAVVLGGGATARSAVAALAQMGAGSVTVCARRPEAAGDVVALARELGLSATAATLEPSIPLIGSDVVISTLPADGGAVWARIAADSPGTLLDAAYHPWPSPLAAAWGSSRVASGRDMLLWQAVDQVRLMTGREPSVDAMRAALRD
jgi:shikimate dehydrogenase